MMAHLRALLREPVATHVAGVWDPVTAALAAQAGHRAVHLSGAVCSAVELGLPDLGYVHGTHIADRAARLMPALREIPLIADADTGYGDALQAIWTAQRYQAAGIAGLHIEDQVQPKRCGHLAGKELLDPAKAAEKVRAVATETDIVLIARTDAYSVAGLEETLRRAQSYLDAGADAVFPEGVTDPRELARFDGMPLVLNMSEAAGSASDATDHELADLGVRLILHPTTAFLAALHAIRAIYQESIMHPSTPTRRRERPPHHDQRGGVMGWGEFTALLGQGEALALGGKYEQ